MRRAWVALLFAPAACLFPDLGDLQGGDVPIEAAADAPIDADANADADAAPDAGFCASNPSHAFCEDFDESTDFTKQFTYVHLSTKGTLANDTTEVTSAPRSLLATVPASGSSGDDAYLTRIFQATATKAAFSFDFRIDSLTAGGASGVFGAIVFDDTLPARHSLAIYVTDSYTSVEESFALPDGGVLFKDHPLSTSVPIGKWTRVTLGIDVSAHTCSASLDGQTVLSAATIDSSWKIGTPAIDLGLTYVASETTAWQARYDDVLFDFQ